MAWPKGAAHPRFSGGNTIFGGYLAVKSDGHPRAHRGYVLEHILIAERALGHALPPHAQVHHVDGKKGKMLRASLVICQDASYHRLLHARIRVQQVGGDPNTDKICGKCKNLKDKSNFSKDSGAWDGLSHRCFECNRADCRARGLNSRRGPHSSAGRR